MSKWYVEYKTFDERSHGYKTAWMCGVEAVDGKAAIEYVKKHVRDAHRFWVCHDDEEEA